MAADHWALDQTLPRLYAAIAFLGLESVAIHRCVPRPEREAIQQGPNGCWSTYRAEPNCDRTSA
jgi:hypothetical protein